MNMFKSSSIDRFGQNELTQYVGHFMLCVGLLGMIVYLNPFTSALYLRMTFSISASVLWIGCWLIFIRIPSIGLTVVWVVIMSMAWFSKYLQ